MECSTCFLNGLVGQELGKSFSLTKMTTSREEIEKRIRELEIAIEKKRRVIDIKFGPGAFDRGIESIKPHKCSKYLDELFHGFSQFEIIAPARNFFKCFIVGVESPLLYPNATNSILETTELEKLKTLLTIPNGEGS